MSDAKRRNGQRLALGLTGFAVVWLLGVWPPPLWWRSHWPRCTAMMRLRLSEGASRGSPSRCPTVRPTELRSISPLLQRMVILGEDWRFRTHHGIDLAEIADALGWSGGGGGGGGLRGAWHRRDRIRGASTITKQLAKNLYLSPSRNPLRKLKEAVTAVRLELALPKDRILELYLGLVEWGPGIWGADAASRQYFGVPASQLDETQAAALAATLPHPRTSNPVFAPARMLARRDLILARYHGVPVYIPPEEELDSLFAIPAITPPVIPRLPDTIAVPVTGDNNRTRKDSIQDRR
jgi:monofunctional biosynthetic peptidoglycan transglycosylase